MTPMKRKRINPVSEKRKKQIQSEKLLVVKLWNKQNGMCANCHKPLGWGSAKHEIKFRSRGGSPVEEGNCVLLCLKCHNLEHGINIV